VYKRSRNSTFWLKWLGGEKGLRMGGVTFENVSNYFLGLVLKRRKTNTRYEHWPLFVKKIRCG